MKHTGCTFEFTRERNDDLLKTWKHIYSSHPYMTSARMIHILVNSPSVRFWVTDERATVVISKIERGISIDSMAVEKQAMFREIHSRYRKLRLDHPNVPMPTLVAQIVRQPAPRFYLTPGSAQVILHKIMKQCKNKSRFHQ